jgi:hypothetical protein
MKPSKSLTSVAAGQQQQQYNNQTEPNGQNHSHHRKQPQPPAPKNDHYQQQQRQQTSNSAPTSPICRCRVMYLGSSVPHITKDGLQGIQEPLRELYPDKASLSSGNAGIDSWLSVWSNGILIENVDETGREVKRFFKIEALHYCAAVKYVPQAITAPNINGHATMPHNLVALPKFLPLDSPHARLQQDNNSNPPIFASILRRTTGVKVLECHAFICKREAAANALVRCCFHAYADTMYAKQIGAEIDPVKHQTDTMSQNENNSKQRQQQQQTTASMTATRRSKSIAALNDVTDSDSQQGQFNNEYSDPLAPRTPRRKSLSNDRRANYHGDDENSDSCASQQQQQQFQQDPSNNLQQQTKRFSKSMHQLNQAHSDREFANFIQDQRSGNLPVEQIFTHNPYASRVPSYPPQNIIDQQQQQQQHLQAVNGGTLRSVRSVAANSIASTLLRSKKHAKAMSMAQLNQQQTMNVSAPNQPMSFHQHQQQQQQSNNPFMTMPPVPPMFMPRANMNGSQTMKLPSRHMLQAMPPMPINFEAMTPKEMKKLLKKSAKYGLNPANFTDNGLPLLPLRPIQVPLAPAHMQPGLYGPPPPPPQSVGGHQLIGSDSQSMFANDQQQQHLPPLDMTDFAAGPPSGTMQPYCLDQRNPMFAPPPPDQLSMMEHPNGPPAQPIKSILVKPNPEFLKSKAGKKWLKQQKEFKKLLPAHLDGLPIVFGPPPLDALEAAAGLPSSPAAANGQQPLPPPPLPPPLLPHPFMQTPQPPMPAGLPVLDTNGFYNPHLLYGPSGRASAASTLLRHSPQVMQQHHQHMQLDEHALEYRNHDHQQSMYSNPTMGLNSTLQAPLPPPPPPPPMLPSHHHHQQQQLSGDEIYVQHQHHQRHNGAQQYAVRRRNHMVEQSVISLDDEDNEDNEQVDDDGTDEGAGANDYEQSFLGGHDQRSQHNNNNNGYYNRVDGDEATIGRHNHHHQQQQHSRPKKEASNGYSRRDDYHDDYEQIPNNNRQAPNEDRNSNSSGIYKRRGHMNERAFSYSIRQEASKSSADNSDAEHRNGGDMSDSSHYQHTSNNNNHIDYHRQSNPSSNYNAMHYDNPQQGNIYQNRPSMQHYKKQSNLSRHHHLQQPMDELSARLDSQLSMKSFANSCVKSNM